MATSATTGSFRRSRCGLFTLSTCRASTFNREPFSVKFEGVAGGEGRNPLPELDETTGYGI